MYNCVIMVVCATEHNWTEHGTCCIYNSIKMVVYSIIELNIVPVEQLIMVACTTDHSWTECSTYCVCNNAIMVRCATSLFPLTENVTVQSSTLHYFSIIRNSQVGTKISMHTNVTSLNC